MEQEVLKIAYAALLHDIGKFYQRTESKSHLSEQEKRNTPLDKTGHYNTHLHSGYTSRFFSKYLQIYGEVERASSGHHLYSSDAFDKLIQEADRIASSVDRSDEIKDFDQNHTATRYRFITSRLHSIMSDVYFGKPNESSVFPLTSIDQVTLPVNDISLTKEEAVHEYKQLFDAFIAEVEKDNLLLGELVTPYKFHRMYALLYKYTTLIPASTYETSCPTVSLFDHLKLTSAIASCLYYSQEKKFYMMEFDVSGIQRFIYQITEGKDTKPQMAKSLRGRSAFISLLTNAITYAILNEFSLTQANIIFNTGGGGVILLPYLGDTESRVKAICQRISKELFSKFNTGLTFVYALEALDEKELELFKTEKALSLKNKLDIAKKQKFKYIIDEHFSYESMNGDYLCNLCGQHIVKNQGMNCSACEDILSISNYYTSHNAFSVYYLFDRKNDLTVDLGFAGIRLRDTSMQPLMKNEDFMYVDAVNHFEFGNVKPLANLVPKNQYDELLNFEQIANSLDTKIYGDRKLAILKMDVDNLGAVFAFGLKQGDVHTKAELQRSLSKYLTLSRFIELFFSTILKKICLKISQRLQSKYEDIFYINYAGGDDLVIIGPVYGIVMLSNEIRDEFRNYVRNPNITLSGGIHIQGSKNPVRFGIKMADEALESSKVFEGKNAITLMGYTVAYDEYSALLDKVEKYRKFVVEGKVSRTSFYNLMTYLQTDSMDDYYVAIPKIQYSLYRQLGDNPIRLELVNELTKAKNTYELEKTILMMKLVILFTREV